MQRQSTGTVVGVSVPLGVNLVTLVDWFSNKVLGMDLPSDVASAIVSIAIALAGAVIHMIERHVPPTGDHSHADRGVAPLPPVS